MLPFANSLSSCRMATIQRPLLSWRHAASSSSYLFPTFLHSSAVSSPLLHRALCTRSGDSSSSSFTLLFHSLGLGKHSQWISKNQHIDRVLLTRCQYHSGDLPHEMSAIKVDAEKGGGVSSLSCVKVPFPSPSPTGYVVRVHATAVNRADVLQRQGKYPPPKGASDILGLEMAGEVVHVGNATRGDFKIGDRVCALLSSGGHAEYVAVEEGSLMAIPPTLSYSQAAAIPEVFLTAYQSLYFHGKINQETAAPTVLVHAGASGVGTAAIQLAKAIHKESKVIVTVGSSKKQDYCTQLGSSLAINYKNENWATACLDYLGKDRVDILIDCIGANYFNDNLKVLGQGGRMIMLGFLGGAVVPDAKLAGIVMKGLTITGSTLRSRSAEYKSSLTRAFVRDCLHKFEEGILKPVIHSTLPWTEIRRAHEEVERNVTIGKVVLTVVDPTEK